MSIRLIKPSQEHMERASAFRQEFLDHGETIINGSEMLDSIDSYDEWLHNIRKNSNPETVDPDWVLTDTFFAVNEAGEIIGIVDFRHELKGFLVDFGHCGYSVRPSERRKGYATKILAQILLIAKEAGLPSLQLSVERTNIPSVKTIVRNGGMLERSFVYNGETADVYRIDLKQE